MNIPTRKIIALAFIAVFFLTAPIVLLRAAGYRYNWKKNAIEKTGVLRLDSEPADAAVVLNGRIEKKRTPALVTALLPDDYRVRIEKKGYLPWEKTLRVQSGRTTFATGVVLFNESLPSQVFAADAVAAAFNADGKGVAFAARRDGVIEIGTAEMPSDKVALAARYSGDDIASPEISWSPDGERFLFRAARKNGQIVASIYRAGGGEPVPLEKKMPAGVRTIRWSSRGDSLLLTAASGIYRADADSGELTALKIGPNALDAVDIDGDVYALRRLGAATSALNLAAGADDEVASLPAGPYRFVETRTLPLIVSDGTASTFIVGKDGIDGDFRSATLAATPEQARAGNRLLLRNDFEIAIWSPDSGLRETVTRLGSAITTARWHPSGAYAVYATREAITAIELDNRDAANAYELIRAGSILDFSLDADGRTLRFIGEIGNQKGLFERTLQ